MKKENQRILLTKQLLQNALLTLLQKRSIHQISISELCAVAGVNRTTFYNHYGSQYDLLKDICSRYLSDIAQRLNEADPTSRESVQQRVTLVLRYIADHMALSSLLLNHNADPAFAQRLFSLQQITDLMECALADCKDPREKAATVSFAIYGSYRLLQEWINTPDRISPEEQTALMLRLARRVCGADVTKKPAADAVRAE